MKPYREAFRTVADFERNLKFGPHSCIVEDANRCVIYRGDDFDEAVLVKLKTPGRALLFEREGQRLANDATGHPHPFQFILFRNGQNGEIEPAGNCRL